MLKPANLVSFGRGLVNVRPTTGGGGGGGGNATVPVDAPIQPPQAFVDYVARFADAHSNLALQNKGITFVAGSMFGKWYGNAINYLDPIVANFSGNALSLASLYEIMDQGMDLGFVCRLDVSGGTNAAVPLPVFVLDFNFINIASGNDYGHVRNSVTQETTTTKVLDFDELYGALDDSRIFWDGNTDLVAAIEIGVTDSPTKQQIIDKLVELGTGRITDLGGLRVQIAPLNHDLEPITTNGYDSFLQLTQGSNRIGTLLSYGWTVTTN